MDMNEYEVEEQSKSRTAMIERRPGSSPACLLGIHFYDEIGNAEYMRTERTEGTKEATVLDFRLRAMTLPALVFSA